FFAVYFAIGTAAVPGLNGFVSEILSLVGVYVSGQGRYGGHLGPVYAIIASLGMILGALYMIYWVAKVLFGPLVEAPELESSGAAASGPAKPTDLSFREWVVLTPLAILVLVLGIFPGPVLDSMQPAINQIRMEVITATSPPPMHGSSPVAAARQAVVSDKLTALAH
ncbi:MAG TPA: hypothetical protein VKJ65_09955, partial [Phycisphaerae bacterium]|nr:hypothetical protein [Phycisphaerae bacterium]